MFFEKFLHEIALKAALESNLDTYRGMVQDEIDKAPEEFRKDLNGMFRIIGYYGLKYLIRSVENAID